MTSLKHPVTGHEVRTDEESSAFWKAAGYREPAPAKKAPVKKSASPKK